MKEIIGVNFPSERDLYGASDLTLKNCSFDGAEDGESALKEARNVKLHSCFMNLRYPLWHDKNIRLDNCTMTEKCRAAIWYSDDVVIRSSNLSGIKALRECAKVQISECNVCSPEFGWKTRDVSVKNSKIESEYLFLLARGVNLENVEFKGKYSFQYVENAVIKNCVLNTKDAFWHSKNVVVENCVVNGEYLGWYSENLTFINCVITGTQPLCYCKGLRLAGCEMHGADLSFEYSDVNAEIKGEILSVKNPKSGKITCARVGEVILTDDSVYKCGCVINETEN